jgi:hypothetical protein
MQGSVDSVALIGSLPAFVSGSMNFGQIRTALIALDRGLVSLSRLFGTGFVQLFPQMVALLGMFGVILALAFLVPGLLSWLMLWLGFVGVVAVSRAWVNNENRRVQIARKLSDVDADTLPDLRLSALISSSMLLFLVPMILKMGHEIYDLFDAPDGASFSDWVLFGLDLLFRALLDWSEVYGVQISDVRYESLAGRHVVMLILLTIDFILIQGIMRMLAIRKSIEEGVGAGVKDPEMAYRLGRRATPRLLVMLDSEDLESDEKMRVLEAIAVIGDPRACPSLISKLDDDVLHTTSIAALVRIKHFSPLFAALENDSEMVRNGAISALGRIADPIAIPYLEEVADGASEQTRVRCVKSYGEMQGSRAREALARALTDKSARVRVTAVQGLGRFDTKDVMTGLVRKLTDDDAEVRLAVATVLARFADARVVEPLVKALEDDDVRVREQARRSLDHLQNVVESRR